MRCYLLSLKENFRQVWPTKGVLGMEENVSMENIFQENFFYENKWFLTHFLVFGLQIKIFMLKYSFISNTKP